MNLPTLGLRVRQQSDLARVLFLLPMSGDSKLAAFANLASTYTPQRESAMGLVVSILKGSGGAGRSPEG